MRKLLSRVLFLLTVMTIAVCSCARDEVLDIAGTEHISFKLGSDALTAVGEITKGSCDTLTYEITDWDCTAGKSDTELQTKGTLTESLSGEVGVFAAVGTTPVMNNARHTVNGSELEPDTKVLWKNYSSGTMKIFSYAPYKSSVPTGTDSGGQYFSYTVNSSIAEQEDLLYATTTRECTDRTAIPLSFKHGLTAVQFRMGFACKVKNITVSNVQNSGKFYLDGTTPSVFSGNATYSLSYAGDGKDVEEGGVVNSGNELMILMPQAFSSDAQTISLTYHDTSGDHTVSARLNGTDPWLPGKKVVYTLKKNSGGETDYIYFDLAAGNIRIGSENTTDATYSGYVFVSGMSGPQEVSGTHKGTNKYYIYQSSSSNKASTGYSSAAEYNTNRNKANHVCRVPSYPEMTVEGKKWREYITNNQNLAAVIDNWTSKATAAGRTYSENYIIVTSVTEQDKTVDIVLDNIWSQCYQNRLNTRDHEIMRVGTYGDIIMYAKAGSTEVKTQAIYRLKGDNRMFHILIPNNRYVSATFTSFQGDGMKEGSLVAAPTTKFTNILQGIGVLGSNDAGFCSASDVHEHKKDEWNTLIFNGGTVFASDALMSSDGTDNNQIMVDANYCWSVIGGGGNTHSRVTVNGGAITALSHSTGAAIGGGGGHELAGGRGEIIITGGETYAYSFGVYSQHAESQGWNPISPVTTIGSGGSIKDAGANGAVTISGGYVYAESVGGCAIGGSNSPSYPGGEGTVTISGGRVYAKSIAGTLNSIAVQPGVTIGGGNGTTGGNAIVHVTGGECYTGSFGGGKSVSGGNIGSAAVTITSGTVSGQFIMAKGAATAPTFTMNGGYIRNSSTSDASFPKVQSNGGAVYMEDGTCTIGGGMIDKCSASLGGAVYMNGGTFSMTGGTISNCHAATHGGAVYIDGGNATVSGGEIIRNLASAGDGGGVYVSGGNFTMPDGSTGKINNNSADASSASTDGNGGGIYVRSTTKNVNVDIIGGEVQYNAADRNGGGLCVDMEGSSYTAAITIGKVGGVAASPYIASNSAALSGGGMAVQGSGSNIVINSGTVKGNVSAYVKNEDIRNDGGQVDLVGKGTEVDVNYKTITFYANNGVDPEPYDEQRVITSTNSPLKPTSTALAFQKEFYHMVSWNTKRDGTGTTYNLNGTGEIMNITADVSLYAQWVQNQ